MVGGNVKMILVKQGQRRRGEEEDRVINVK